MPAKPSGEIKTRTIRNVQKNGDIYVLERKTLYDREKKHNKVLSTTLISKIPKGSEIPVPTRPKKYKSSKVMEQMADIPFGVETKTDRISAIRQRVGMMSIIEHIGNVSGIDAALYEITDKGTAQKIISIARYLLATNGQSLSGISTWQYNHPLPYTEGISEDIYHQLFTGIGLDESLRQNFFLNRCESIKHGGTLAYDSTTFSTYSENQIEARYGFNKAGDGLKTIKYLSLYSIDTRQPIAFTKQPGNLPDVLTIDNALQQLMALGLTGAEIVTDNGYYSEQNMSEMFSSHFDFITLAKPSLKWIREEINNHVADFDKLSSACPFDPATHGITITTMHEFTKIRKYSNKKAGVFQGDREMFTRRIYLHLFYNATRKVDEDHCFERELLSLKQMLEDGTAVNPPNESVQKKIKKYLSIRTWGKTTHIGFNEKACAETKKYHGYFILVSNSEKNTFEALSKYRKREYIEDYFRSAKQHTDSTRVRVWDADTLRGRMFVQFISLCYYEYLSEEIRKLKLVLSKPNGDKLHDSAKNLKLEKKLKSWINNTPIYLQLQWFDAIEGVHISNALQSKRWATEITARDKMYLEKLGLKSVFQFEYRLYDF